MVNKFLHTALFILCSWCCLAQSIEIDYPETVTSNQQFTIKYTVEGSRVSSYSISGNPNELKVINPNSPSTSSQNIIQNNNGKRSTYKSTSFSYTVKPVAKNGTVNLPILTVQADGKTLTSQALTINIVPPSALANREKFIASLELSSNTIFEGETVIAELKLYLSEEANKVETDGLTPLSGLFIKKLDQDGYEQGQSLFNGKLYNHAILARYEITGDSAKTYTIPAIDVKAIKRIVEKGTGFYRTTRDIPTSVTSAPQVLKVLPLTGGKSENYLGVFDKLDLSTSLPRYTENSQALELTLTLSGQGSFNTIITPQLRALKKHYDLFQPATKEAFKQTDQGQVGLVSYTYTLVPKKTGVIVTDSLALQYFNTTTEQFEYLTIPSFSVTISEDEADASVDFSPSEELEFTPYPIWSEKSYSRPWFTLSKFLWLLVVIALGVAGYALQRLMKQKRNARKKELPALTPVQEFNLAITKIKSDIMNTDFSGDVLQAIENYLVQSYPVERSNFSKETLSHFLSAEDANQLKALLTELELGEYAGVAARRLRSESGKKELIETAESIIKRLENS